jgi:phospholipid/cholesterol/gamma-HCH transport system permease protein
MNKQWVTGQKITEGRKSDYAFIPRSLKLFLNETGATARFAARFFRETFATPFEFKEVLRQGYEIGFRSLPLVGITAFIIGLVLTLQSRPTLVDFGAESLLPSMVGISLIREIGPVITALICAGKIGSGIGAELGSMKVTEQIDAMEVSGTNPFRFIVVSRIIATTLTIPILTIIGDTIALYGSYLAVNIRGSVTFTLFFKHVFESLEFSDIVPAIIKTFFFGFAIGLIGCYKGYTTQKGTEGVGRSANSAVVIASLLVFIIDLVAVQITEFFGFL